MWSLPEQNINVSIRAEIAHKVYACIIVREVIISFRDRNPPIRLDAYASRRIDVDTSQIATCWNWCGVYAIWALIRGNAQCAIRPGTCGKCYSSFFTDDYRSANRLKSASLPTDLSYWRRLNGGKCQLMSSLRLLAVEYRSTFTVFDILRDINWSTIL